MATVSVATVSEVNCTYLLDNIMYRLGRKIHGLGRENTQMCGMYSAGPLGSARPKKKNSCVQVSLPTLILGPTLKMLNFF